MNTLAHSHKEQGKDTLPAWVEKSIIEQARGQNLSMAAWKDTHRLSEAPNEGRALVPGSRNQSRPMLLNLRSKGRVGRRARVLNLGNVVTKLKPAKSRTATLRRAESSKQSLCNQDRQAAGCAATFRFVKRLGQQGAEAQVTGQSLLLSRGSIPRAGIHLKGGL